MKYKDRLYKKIRGVFHVDEIERKLDQTSSILMHEYLESHLYKNPKYSNNNKRLNKYEYQVYSQHGEDGIINEIFERIGTTNQFFVEFGVEDGSETNSTYLLMKGWSGLWIEADGYCFDAINQSFSKKIQQEKLAVLNSFITAENIEHLFAKSNVPHDMDLLSIDIDGNDYHVWKAIRNYSPRVVIIEYNSIFRPGDCFIVDYNANAVWDKSSHFGASLESYFLLGKEKGYSLVACDFTGTNAFFVRNDLVGNYFHEPFTPLEHYEPPRYFLNKKDGHFRKIKNW